MGSADPTVDDTRILTAESIGGQPYRGRHGGDPIQPVKNSEPVESAAAMEQGMRQEEKREPAQRIVREKQIPAREAIRKPA